MLALLGTGLSRKEETQCPGPAVLPVQSRPAGAGPGLEAPPAPLSPVRVLAFSVTCCVLVTMRSVEPAGHMVLFQIAPVLV